MDEIEQLKLRIKQLESKLAKLQSDVNRKEDRGSRDLFDEYGFTGM